MFLGYCYYFPVKSLFISLIDIFFIDYAPWFWDTEEKNLWSWVLIYKVSREHSLWIQVFKLRCTSQQTLCRKEPACNRLSTEKGFHFTSDEINRYLPHVKINIVVASSYFLSIVHKHKQHNMIIQLKGNLVFDLLGIYLRRVIISEECYIWPCKRMSWTSCIVIVDHEMVTNLQWKWIFISNFKYLCCKSFKSIKEIIFCFNRWIRCSAKWKRSPWRSLDLTWTPMWWKSEIRRNIWKQDSILQRKSIQMNVHLPIKVTCKPIMSWNMGV